MPYNHSDGCAPHQLLVLLVASPTAAITIGRSPNEPFFHSAAVGSVCLADKRHTGSGSLHTGEVLLSWSTRRSLDRMVIHGLLTNSRIQPLHWPTAGNDHLVHQLQAY